MHIFFFQENPYYNWKLIQNPDHHQVNLIVFVWHWNCTHNYIQVYSQFFKLYLQWWKHTTFSFASELWFCLLNATYALWAKLTLSLYGEAKRCVCVGVWYLKVQHRSTWWKSEQQHLVSKQMTFYTIKKFINARYIQSQLNNCQLLTKVITILIFFIINQP